MFCFASTGPPKHIRLQTGHQEKEEKGVQFETTTLKPTYLTNKTELSIQKPGPHAGVF